MPAELPLPMGNESCYALIIGIGAYQDENIRGLRYTEADARAFYDMLTDPERAGFPPANVKLLLDEQATMFNVRDAMSRWLFSRAQPDSTVIVFFAGHGHAERDRTGTEEDGFAKYLLPWDTKTENLMASAISNVDFKRLLSTIKARRLVTFLDACYSGGLANADARDVGVLDASVQPLGVGKGRLTIAAAQPNQRSYEDEALGHGIFTHHLIKALRGDADSDQDGCVTVMEVFKYLEKSVPSSVRRLKAEEQNPVLAGSITDDITLTINPVRAQELAQRRQAEECERRLRKQERLHKLADLLGNGELPDDVYHEAVGILVGKEENLNDKQRRLLWNLKPLADDGIPAEVYLENRRAILGLQRAEASAGSARSKAARPEPASRPHFCTHCGHSTTGANKFCTGCGHKF